VTWVVVDTVVVGTVVVGTVVVGTVVVGTVVVVVVVVPGQVNLRQGCEHSLDELELELELLEQESQ